MSFLNPWFFLGALTLAVPILIHLVRKEKSETIQFSTLMFLLRVPKRAIRQQRLKNLLLMLLRLTLLALLVLMFARPYFTEPPVIASTDASNRGVVFMLDNSYSMQYGDTMSRMKTDITRRIDTLGAGDRAGLIAFNDRASVLVAPTNDKNALKAAVSTLEATPRGTSYYEAFLLAERMLNELAPQGRQLVIASDFQRNGWTRSSRESVISPDVKAEFVDLSVEKPANVGLESASVDATTFSRTYAGRVVARISNHRTDQPAAIPVALFLNDREQDRKVVNVPPRSSALAEFSGFELPIGFTRGKLKIDLTDPLLVDNELLFVLERREKLKVLILNNGRPRQSFFLEQAFTSSPELPFDVRTMAASAATPDEVARHEIVIVDDVPRLTEAVASRLAQTRKGGQGQWVILGESADLGWWGSVRGFPVKPLQKVFTAKDRNRAGVSLTSYDRGHPIFRTFEGSSRLTLQTAQFFAFVNTESQNSGRVLAKFESGEAALVESARDDTGLLVFNSGLDSRWSDLPLKPSFVPFAHQAILYLAHYSESRAAYQLGEAVPVVGGELTSTGAVIAPDGARLALGQIEPGQQRYFSPEAVGFFDVRVERASRLVAVNPPSAEGNLDRLPPEDLMAAVRRTTAESTQTLAGLQEERDAYARKQTGWWYVLVLALIAALAEIYFANRSPGRAGGAV